MIGSLREWVSDMPATARKLANTFVYLAETPGSGVLFPLAYGILLVLAWPCLDYSRAGFVIAGIFLGGSALLSNSLLRWYLGRRRAEHQELSARFDQVEAIWIKEQVPGSRDAMAALRMAIDNLGKGLRVPAERPFPAAPLRS